MDLRAVLGEQYKENMTLAEVEAALAGIVMHTDDEVKTNFVAKRLFDKTASDLAAAKRGAGAAAEKAKTDLDAALERITTLEAESKAAKRDSEVAKNTAAYVALGYSEELAKSTAEAMADGDTAKVNANLAAFVAQKTQSIKEELMKGTKPPAAGGSASGGGVFDYAKAKAAALASGNDIEYMRLCREEAEQTAKKLTEVMNYAY